MHYLQLDFSLPQFSYKYFSDADKKNCFDTQKQNVTKFFFLPFTSRKLYYFSNTSLIFKISVDYYLYTINATNPIINHIIAVNSSIYIYCKMWYCFDIKIVGFFQFITKKMLNWLNPPSLFPPFEVLLLSTTSFFIPISDTFF